MGKQIKKPVKPPRGAAPAANSTPAYKKKYPAPKGAELKLESKSSIKRKAIKTYWDNLMQDNPHKRFPGGAQQVLNEERVKMAFKEARAGKKKKK